jgi:hypothetical protein
MSWFWKNSAELKGGKTAPKAVGAVVGDGEGIVGKKAECAMVANVGECKRGRAPPREGANVGVRGEMSDVRLTSGTMMESPGPLLRKEAEALEVEGFLSPLMEVSSLDPDAELLFERLVLDPREDGAAGVGKMPLPADEIWPDAMAVAGRDPAIEPVIYGAP